jgi:hypothetical protein
MSHFRLEIDRPFLTTYSLAAELGAIAKTLFLGRRETEEFSATRLSIVGRVSKFYLEHTLRHPLTSNFLRVAQEFADDQRTRVAVVALCFACQNDERFATR